MDKFEQLVVWQKAHALALDVYAISKRFPIEERFGLTSQMRRSVVSVPSNIAEGAERRSLRDRVHFHDMARTSLEELKYQLILSRDLRYVSVEQYERLVAQAREVGKMLRGLDRSL
ncbi:MAG: four helix bundle protein [bacterium]|nr:four helix bundle protein [bacterium]